jgi:release factor glutamine methyltransferase
LYGREFIVTPAVLSPRPETEQIIETIKDIATSEQILKILDVGTGSGVIAITLALELPRADIVARDISKKDLEVAKQNAKTLDGYVQFIRSDLLQEIPGDKFDIIVANLPYVSQKWETSPDTAYEPEMALFANDGGLELIKKLIQQAPKFLKTNGLLVLELDPRQIKIIKTFALNHGLVAIDEKPFTLTLQSRCVPKAVEQK